MDQLAVRGGGRPPPLSTAGFRGGIQIKTWLMGPYAAVDCASPYVHFRVDSNTFTMGNPIPEGAMLVHPRPMCPDRKFLDVATLGQSVPWLFCPWPNHPIPLIWLSEATPDFKLPRALAPRSGGVLCVGRVCIRRRGANPINLVRGVGEAGQTPQWFIRCRRPTEAAIAADGASSMLVAVQGRDTSVRETISKGRFVQGAHHPRIFVWGHINPASARVGLNPIPESTLSPSQGLWIKPLDWIFTDAVNGFSSVSAIASCLQR